MGREAEVFCLAAGTILIECFAELIRIGINYVSATSKTAAGCVESLFGSAQHNWAA
jgi:hypothetical protein